VVSDTSILDHISGCEILSLAIVNTSNTPFADFLKEVGSTEWVRQGHADYHAKAGGKCPYCSQDLLPNFEEMLAASFDTQYQTNLQKLDAFLAAYRDAANALFVPLSRLPEEVYPVIDTKPYHDKLTAVKAVIAENIEKIKSKVAEPSKIVALDEVEPILQELSDIISGFNRLIDANNDIVSAGPKKKAECKKAVFEQIAYTLKDVLEAYERSEMALDAEIQAQQDIIDTQKGVLDQLKEDLRILNSQTVETETAMKSINTMLRDSGFQGFELRPRHEEIIRPDGSVECVVPTPAINYEVVRTDTGQIAENLSEGEKNFIAFLYFQQLVFGRESADGDTREKIVVIDDPVSSMDSSALFIVSAQIRKMIEVCRNNADNRNPVVSGNFIKQIFILTHNAYFHREVTYAYANRYDFVSFYLIRKTDNKSSIRLCDCPNPDCPSERMNVNPVKNSYAALWDEYKDASSGIPLMSIIRRILEYYFLQLCGYEGSDLRKRILEENKDAFTHDDFGNEDFSKFELASAMLSYIAANSSGINDGMHYVDDCIDVQQCRDTFQMIFHHMGQDQHYEMMMGMK
jgi:wobble nucleotide-excising tRNase